MTSLAEFLLARIAEDEAVARQQGAPWSHRWKALGGRVRAGGSTDARIAEGTLQSATHIARHDPARVLAECEAKRQIVTEAQTYSPDLEHGDDGEWVFNRMLRLLAVPYADHPDYDEEWRP